MIIRRIERIPKEDVAKEGQKGLSHEEKLKTEYSDLLAQNLQMRDKLKELTLIKERMSNIIEICEINSHQNEKWIIVGPSNLGSQ